MSLSLSSQDIAVLKQSFFLTFWRSEASLVPFVRVPPYESRLVQKSNLNNKVKSTISCMWAKDGQVGSGRGSKQPTLVTKLREISAFRAFLPFLSSCQGWLRQCTHLLCCIYLDPSLPDYQDLKSDNNVPHHCRARATRQPWFYDHMSRIVSWS